MLVIASLIGVLVAWGVITSRGAKYAVPLNALILVGVIVRLAVPAAASQHGCGLGATIAVGLYAAVGLIAYVAIVGSLLVHYEQRKRGPALPRATTLTTTDRT